QLKLDADGNAFEMFGTIQDISEQKEAEKLVRKLSDAVTYAGGSLMITNKLGIIEYVNPAFTKVTGYSAEEVIGLSPRILKSGDQNDAFYASMWQTISRGEIWHGKVIDRKKDGSFFPAMLTIAPITDDEGVITHFIGSHADITELEDMEQQFHQAQKMEAVGTLVGGIAHDFNNMLAGITGNLYLARMHLKDNPKVEEKLANVEQLSFRAADMIKQLLTFARKDRVSMKAFPFTSFLKETLKLLSTAVPESIEVQQDICTDHLQINGDATLLHQVLMNLLNNAIDAVEQVTHPSITIRLETFHPDEAMVASHVYFELHDYLHLSVQDNGCGIPAEQLEHVFEPFFTSKEQGKGTGLGLAMAFGAIKTHAGLLEVESVQGAGSSFHVYIPLLASASIESESSAVPGIHAGQGELILLADDEPHIISVGKEVLEALGYRVLTATNGQQAVELFAAHADEIDLCVFDMVMPVMGGDQAAQVLRQIKPEIKVIFSTGYDKNLQDISMRDETVLSKPFSIAEMSRVIQQVLHG
ncbi:PAS domain S-box protein, partial [Mariprofundus ferrooxydans]|nr:PAS domain S-box protein [Mariprofundus ferrooxydans]